MFRNALALVAASLLLACTGTSDSVQTDALAELAVEDATSTPDETDPADIFVDESVDIRWDDLLPPNDVEGVFGDDAILPGFPGAPCQTADECNSGFCIHAPQGKVCTTACQEECPFGWDCVLHTPSLPDELYICAPSSIDLCRPCDVNADCSLNGIDADQACIPYGPEGHFCGEACEANDDCPPEYGCQEVQDVTGATSNQCVLSNGLCPCAQWDIDQAAETACYFENEFGLCHGTRHCNAWGLSPCDALLPAAETCDGLDNDCDNLIDEEIIAEECLVINEHGTCPGTLECDTGKSKCVGKEPEPEICDGLDNDCDGEADENFADTDGDGKADCLSDDKDGDNIPDGVDNCPLIFNPAQEDFDLDTTGNACDPDDDGDFVADDEDCNPKDASVHPGAEELCDGKDNNCNGIGDEGYPDSDDDSWADCMDEDDDNDGTPDGQDCAPTDASISPKMVEECDGLDNDCDNSIDEGFADEDEDGTADCVDEDSDGDGLFDVADNCPKVANPEQEDLDQDGLGDLCDSDLDGDSIPNATDNCPNLKNTLQSDVDADNLGDPCDGDQDNDGLDNEADNCPLTANPDQKDQDSDGVGDLCEEDLDGDGVDDKFDCAPLNPAAYPGAEEVCDGTDNDCNGAADEGFPDGDNDGLKNCVDLDDDGDGTPDDADCAPLNDTVHPDAQELCDGLDNDCNDAVDDGLGKVSCGKGECAHAQPACLDGKEQLCDPYAGIAQEICDGKDNDCDGLTDEDLGTTTCGLGICLHTDANCTQGEVVECDPFKGVGEEVCDGLDNDCDGKTDEDQPLLACGKGQCFHNQASCIGGVSYECKPFAGASQEVCDGQDNDCDGDTDEGFGTTTCGKGLCEHTIDNCVGGWPQLCNPLEGSAPESCDGLDNDCNGFVDETMGTTTCGQGACQNTVENCVDGAPQECNPVAGAEEEICDGEDNDCDGQIDEQLGLTTCGVGACIHTTEVCKDGEVQECDPDEGSKPESCDGLDNDCDGETDEDYPDTDADGEADCIDTDDDNDGDADLSDCAPLDKSISHFAEEICFNGTDDDCSEASPDECILASCLAILQLNDEATTGIYTIDPDGDDPIAQFKVWCDMETEGGGWTLVGLTNGPAELGTADYDAEVANDYTGNYVKPLKGTSGTESRYECGASGSGVMGYQYNKGTWTWAGQYIDPTFAAPYKENVTWRVKIPGWTPPGNESADWWGNHVGGIHYPNFGYTGFSAVNGHIFRNGVFTCDPQNSAYGNGDAHWKSYNGTRYLRYWLR